MFQEAGIAELDGNAAAAALVAARARVVAAEAELVVLPALERAVQAGADGCPDIMEFAGAELAAAPRRVAPPGPGEGRVSATSSALRAGPTCPARESCHRARRAG
jgi:hypothetical protein